MKRLTLLCILFAGAAFAVEDTLVRNPFWPQGYEGLRYPITTEPRVKPKPKPKPTQAETVRKAVKDGRTQAAAAEKAAREREAARLAEEDRRWQVARSALAFGGIMSFKGPGGTRQTAVTINDRIYAPGDLVSANCGGMRFTWKVEDISSKGKIKLRRVKCGAPKTEPKP